MNNSREPVRATSLEEPRHQPRPDQEHERNEYRHLADGESQRHGQAAAGELGSEAARVPSQRARQRRKEYKSEHHHEVLDDQPPDRDAAIDRIERIALLQRAQQHDGTGDRQRQSQHQAGADAPAPQKRERHAAARGNRDLRKGAGHGNGAHRQQVRDREMQAYAEHQENDADFGELAREICVSYKSGRERTECHAGEEIAYKRRQEKPVSDQAPKECQHQSHGDRGDERDVVRHLSPDGAQSANHDAAPFSVPPALPQEV